jgi:CSLREA domain-containing protein
MSAVKPSLIPISEQMAVGKRRLLLTTLMKTLVSWFSRTSPHVIGARFLILVTFIATLVLIRPATAGNSVRPADRGVRHEPANVIIPVAPPLTFVVNSLGDAPDSNIGDGVCDTDSLTEGDQCTLRAAIQEANVAVGTVTINFNLPAFSTITLNNLLPDIVGSLIINGLGVDLLTVRRSAVAGTPDFRIFSIATGATVMVSGLTISNGNLTGGDYGGGVLNNGTLTLTNSTVSGNHVHTAAAGGGILNHGTLTLTSSTVSGNSADSGGGVFNSGILTVTNSVLSGNTGEHYGGSIYNNSSAMATLTNSTVSGNNTIFGSGAGIYNLTGTVRLTNSTVTHNSAYFTTGGGGGVFNYDGPTNLKNTIVADNTVDGGATGPDLNGAFNSEDYNLIGIISGATISGTTMHNITNVDARLGPLANNGGPTQTHALLLGSPAIDAGNSSQTTDQRGQVRPIDDPNVVNAAGGNASDIGAYEANIFQVNTTIDADDGACTALGTGNGCTLREAINAANVATFADVAFAPALTSGGPATINLLTALPTISSTIIIQGPGSNLLTVQRSTAGGTPDFRVLQINTDKSLSITGVTISNGSAVGSFPSNVGGNFFNQGTLIISNCVVKTAAAGGGIGNFSGSLTINNSVVSGNNGSGGAIFSTVPQSDSSVSPASVTINNSTLSANTGPAINNSVIVGNASSPATVAINNSTISGNNINSAGSGAGIRNGVGTGGIATITITNSTISGNTNGSNGTGGIYNAGVLTDPTNPTIATVTVTSSTIFGNVGSGSGAVGGISNFSSCNGCVVAVKLRNSIVAGNNANSGATPSDISGLVDSNSSSNLIGVGGSGGLTNGVNNNQVGVVNPGLGPLADNGGPTQTHALLAGSPALDGGNNAFVANPPFGGPPFTDQRGTGFARVVDGPDPDTTDTVDIGAFEAQVSVADIADTSFDEDGSASFPFNVGGSASITSVVANSSNTTLVPNNSANLSVTGSGSSRTLTINPVANQFGNSTITVTVIGTNGQSMSDTFLLTILPVADTPSVTNATTIISKQSTSGLVISRNPVDGAEVTHFKITKIQNGTLFKNDGTTQIANGAFITFTEGSAGLKFTPGTDLFSPGTTFSFQVQGATSSSGNGLSSGAATATITVTCVVSSIVTNSNDGGAGSLRDAIINACPGGAIGFNIPTSDPGYDSSTGVFTVTLTSADLTIDRIMEIIGPAGSLLTIKRSTAGGTPNFRIFTIGAVAVTMSNLTITNGRTPDGVGPTFVGGSGGGLLNNGLLSMTNVTLSGNNTGSGSVAGGSGGGIANFGNLFLTDSSVSGNQTGNGGSAGSGGGIFNSGTITLTNTSVSANHVGSGSSSGGKGGGIYSTGVFTLTNSKIYGNQAVNGGGGIYNDGPSAIINNCNIGGTSAGQPNLGEGIRHNGGSGVIPNSGTLLITGGSIVGNSGDGIAIIAPANLKGVAITDNGPGGGVFISGNGSNVTNIVSCLIANNTNSSNGGFGGGGIVDHNFGTTNVVNSTISGNTTAGLGGGIWKQGATLNLSNVTVTNNRGAQAGGISVGASVVLKNTIVAGNFRGPSPSSTPDDIQSQVSSSSSFNVIGACDTCGLSNGVNNNQVGVLDPGLGLLANNGGPTRTHALLAGSPALDAGSNANLPPDTLDLNNNNNLTEPIPFDQRGVRFKRVVDGNADGIATVDIGALEAQLNPIDGTDVFVRQQYLDFLNRQPDQSGLDFWTNQITSCGTDQTCIDLKRINVSAAFFLSIEFQDTGYLVERIYKAAYGSAPGNSTFGGPHLLPVPIIRLSEFLPDTQEIGMGVVVGQGNWQQQLEANKQAFTAEFVQRLGFTTAFPNTMTAAQFVDTLNLNAGNPLSQSERDQLVNDLSTNAKTRAQVLRAVAEDPDLNSAEFNRAFVLMQYFGYLRRNPNDAPDNDYTGYDFWLTKLNQFNGNFVNAEMVKAFISSGEYRQRFGP